MSTLYVDTITEKTSGNGVQIADLVPAAGSVLQVVHNTQTGSSASSSTLSYADTGLSVSITPLSASSKILVFANTNVAANKSSSNVARYDIRLVNGDASVTGCDKRFVGTDYQASGNFSTIDALQGYFSPASTTAQTFKVQARIAHGLSSQANNITPAWHTGDQSGDAIHTITAMEIAQ